jgi:ferredoxin
MRVIVDLEKCVAAGNCVSAAPGVFDQEVDGMVVVLQEHPTEAERDAARKAAQICPAMAITIEE